MPTTTHRPHHRLAALAAVGTVLALGVTACGTTGPSASDADVASVRFVAAVPTTATPTGPEEAPPAPSATPAPTTAAPAPTTVAPTAGTDAPTTTVAPAPTTTAVPATTTTAAPTTTTAAPTTTTTAAPAPADDELVAPATVPTATLSVTFTPEHHPVNASITVLALDGAELARAGGNELTATVAAGEVELFLYGQSGIVTSDDGQTATSSASLVRRGPFTLTAGTMTHLSCTMDACTPVAA